MLKNQVAIIVGASSGIGKSIAIAYAVEGAKVVLAARNSENLKDVASQIRKQGGTAKIIETDVCIERSVLGLFKETLGDFGRVDILVNSAGITASGVPIDELSLETWSSVINVNLTGAFLCSREAFKVMKAQGGGRIINIGSTSARVPRANSEAYTSAKFGIEGLTRSLALDGRQFGISASILHPGNTESAIWGGHQETFRQNEGLMRAEDVARIAVLMASLPKDINMLESIILPLKMPFLGRG